MAEHKVPLGGVTIGCEVRGDGEPVVLLHGFPLDRQMWDAQLGALAKEFQIIAPDLRGCGKSTLEPADIEAGIGMDRYANDVVAVLDALGVTERVVLVGFSMGGYVAFQVALRHQYRLRGLVLVDTRAGGDTEEAVAARRKMAGAVLAEGHAEPALVMLDKLLSPETHELRPEIVAAAKAMILRQSADGIAAAQRGMARREDVRDNLWEIKVPTLCIVGLSDVISKPDEMQEIATTLPSGKLLEIPGGHLTPMENADAVTEGIREFCRGL